jgi:hypothetical protein
MINLDAINSSATIANGLASLILVTPENKGIQPQKSVESIESAVPNPNQDTIFFNYVGEESIVLNSDITDHYVEDNSAIQDQVALRPIEFSVTGFVGEVNDVAPDFLKPLKLASQKLTVISGYVPEISTTALIAYNQALFLYQTARNVQNSAVQAWNTFNKNELAKNRQQEMFFKLSAYWKERVLFRVQTPWRVFKNMAIKSLRVTQPQDENTVSNFEVVFKEMRFAVTKTISSASPEGEIKSSRLKNQTDPEVNLGSQNVVETSPLGDFIPLGSVE